MWISYEPWRRAAAVVHVGFCGDYQLKDKKPLLIGPAESMPLPCFNRLHAWNYTCPMMGSRVSHYLLVYSEQQIWSDWQCNGGKNTTGKLRCHQNEAMMVFCKRPRLLDFAKTPTHLQFNKYVLTGYRPVSTAQECLRSLFYMHNELGNIYTHGESRGHCMMITILLIRDRLSNITVETVWELFWGFCLLEVGSFFFFFFH